MQRLSLNSWRCFSTLSGGVLDFELKNEIATLTLNNVKKRNALSMEMVDKLFKNVRELKNNHDGIRMLVLKANGPVFSSGHNLVEVHTFLLWF